MDPSEHSSAEFDVIVAGGGLANIDVRLCTVVEEIVGDNTVTGLRIRTSRSAATNDLDVTGVFVFVGLKPNTEFVPNELTLDSSGRIRTDAWMRTDLDGVLAAGSVRADSSEQAANAVGDGVTAAIGAHRYLSGGDS